MRRYLEIAGLCALALLVVVTGRALYGPARLPARVPTHFALNGRPDAWGSSVMLLVLPAIAVGLYVLMSVVARYPAAFNYPVRVTPRNRPRLEALALDMIAWLKMELACMFAAIQWFAIRVAGHPGQAIPPALMPLVLVAVFATIAGHIAAMVRAARRPPAVS
jgi:uncharacterized membrane protein